MFGKYLYYTIIHFLHNSMNMIRHNNNDERILCFKIWRDKYYKGFAVRIKTIWD